jgi:hypothetical protein
MMTRNAGVVKGTLDDSHAHHKAWQGAITPTSRLVTCNRVTGT